MLDIPLAEREEHTSSWFPRRACEPGPATGDAGGFSVEWSKQGQPETGRLLFVTNVGKTIYADITSSWFLQRMITSSSAPVSPGTVYLVGAGPGDPGLITLRGVECLRQADLVLCDYLVNPTILEHAPASAERLILGYHGVGRSLSPDEITARMLEAARQGKTVVRLKGGDPSVFGRGADEMGALREAGIPFEIVPGITAGLAVAAYCEIPITHHEDASAVALIVGQERHCKLASCLDYEALARFPGTLVFYMGVGTAARWSQGLIEHGKPPETPVAIVRMCSRTEQQTIRCTLETVVQTIASQEIRPPAVFVIGKVVDRAPELSWFAGGYVGRRPVGQHQTA